MMKIIYFLISFLLLCFFSCSNRDGKNDLLPKYSIGDIYNKPEDILLEDFAEEVKIIPLETPEEALINFSMCRVYLYKDLLFVRHNSRCSVFNLDGKYLYDIGKKGKGPNEYVSVTHFYFRDNYIIFRDMMSIDKMTQFTLDGKYVRSWKAPQMLRDYYWLEDDLFVGFELNKQGQRKERVVFFDTHGRIKKTFPQTSWTDTPPKFTMSFVVGEGYFYYYNNRTFLSLGTCDTIFMVTPKFEINPAYVVDLGGYRLTDEKMWEYKLAVEPKQRAVSVFHENEGYLLMLLGSKDENQGDLLTDKKTGKTKSIRVKFNKELQAKLELTDRFGEHYGYFRFRDISANHNYLIGYELPKVKDSCEEENPIVFLVKMKDKGIL